jgi:hypothetical protein
MISKGTHKDTFKNYVFVVLLVSRNKVKTLFIISFVG